MFNFPDIDKVFKFLIAAAIGLFILGLLVGYFLTAL